MENDELCATIMKSNVENKTSESEEDSVDDNETNCKDQNYDGLKFVDVGNITDSSDDRSNVTLNCQLCGKSCDSTLKLNQHILIEHSDQVETCNLCRVSFFDKESCITHRNKHITRKENVFKCSLCPQAFFNRSKLIYHEIGHGTERVDDGMFLENDYIHSVILPTHGNEYIGYENLFTCDLCSKSFQLRSSLDRHRQTHNKIKTIDSTASESNTEKVKEGCSQNLENRSVLKFLCCMYCSRLFANKDSFMKHIVTHEQNEKKKKYICKYCQKRYMFPAMLFTHFRKAHKYETPFVCLNCDKYFNKRQEFSLHIKSVHQNVGNIKFDKNCSIVYGESAIPTELQISNEIPNITFDLNVSSLDNCFQETRFLDVNTDDFDLDSNNFEEISLDTDCFNTGKNNDFVDMLANIESNASNDSYVTFNDDILNILESSKPDDIIEDNIESVIPMEEVMPSNIMKDPQISTESPKSCSKVKEKENDLIECNVCGVNLKKKSAKNHLSLHYNKSTQKFRCYICLMTFRTKIKLDIHVRDHFKNDKKLCACGVKCKSDEDMKKHKEECSSNFFSFQYPKPSATNDNNIDSLNKDSIIIFDAEQNTCLILNDSAENRDYVKNVSDIRNVFNSTGDSSSTFKVSSPIFKNPINIPYPEVIVRRITREEAAMKPKMIIKATSVEDITTSPENMISKVTVQRNPVVDNVSCDNESEERILVNVNPLAHLLPMQDKTLTEKKSNSKGQKLDYASIIKRSLNNIVLVKK